VPVQHAHRATKTGSTAFLLFRDLLTFACHFPGYRETGEQEIVYVEVEAAKTESRPASTKENASEKSEKKEREILPEIKGKPWRRANKDNLLEAKALRQINDPDSLAFKTRLYDNEWSKPNRLSTAIRVPEGEFLRKLAILEDDARKTMIQLAKEFWPKLYAKEFHQNENTIGFRADQQIWRAAAVTINGNTIPLMKPSTQFLARLNVTWREFERALDHMSRIATAVSLRGVHYGWSRVSTVDEYLEIAQEFFCVTDAGAVARKIRKWRDDYMVEAEQMWTDINKLDNFASKDRQADWDRKMWDLSYYHRMSIQLMAKWEADLEEYKNERSGDWIWQDRVPPDLAKIIQAYKDWRERKDVSRKAAMTALPAEELDSDDDNPKQPDADPGPPSPSGTGKTARESKVKKAAEAAEGLLPPRFSSQLFFSSNMLRHAPREGKRAREADWEGPVKKRKKAATKPRNVAFETLPEEEPEAQHPYDLRDRARLTSVEIE